ncbi:MAG: hypothetical protein AAGC95_17855 [Pseudomonadota bacterium]
MSHLPAGHLCISALIALAVLLSPAASAGHADEHLRAACFIAHSAEALSPIPSGEHDHGHHVHSCGACHIHMHRKDAAPETPPFSAQAKLRPPRVAIPLRAPPGALFRPPKA